LTGQSGIAQLAEQLTVNQRVAGSSPAPGAVDGALWGPVRHFGAVAQWLEQGTHNPWVVGSIPTRPTRLTAALG
jgi:hypothetical protein